MKKLLSLLFLIIIFGLTFSCSSYVPFTQKLKDKIQNNNLKIEKIQFYTDRKFYLERNLDSEDADVKKGEVILKNGFYFHRIIIPKLMPGVYVHSERNNSIWISFEEGISIEFGSRKEDKIDFGSIKEDKIGDFRLFGNNWINGTADTTYEGKTYRMKLSNKLTVARVTLLMKRSDRAKLKLESGKVKGRKID